MMEAVNATAAPTVPAKPSPERKASFAWLTRLAAAAGSSFDSDLQCLGQAVPGQVLPGRGHGRERRADLRLEP